MNRRNLSWEIPTLPRVPSTEYFCLPSPQPTAKTTVLSDFCVHCAFYSNTCADQVGRGTGLVREQEGWRERVESTHTFPASIVGTDQAPKNDIQFHKHSPTPTKRKAQPLPPWCRS